MSKNENKTDQRERLVNEKLGEEPKRKKRKKRSKNKEIKNDEARQFKEELQEDNKGLIEKDLVSTNEEVQEQENKKSKKVKKPKKTKPKKVKKTKSKKKKGKEETPLINKKEDGNVNLFTASNIMSFLIYATAIMVFAYLHALSPIFIGLLLLLIILVIPFSFRADYIYEYQKNRFYQYTTYLKYINVNYKTTNKVDAALRDTKEVFEPDTEMYKYIEEAEKAIIKGIRPAEALHLIDKHYDNPFMKIIHKFMDLGEMHIGDLSHKPLAQVNYQDWVSDAESFNLEKGKIKTRNNIFTIAALGLTWFTFNSLDMFREEIIADPLYQMITFIYFVLMIAQFFAISQMTKSDWLKEV